MNKSSITINNYDNFLTISVTDQSNLIDHVPAHVYRSMIRDGRIILIKDRPTFNLPQLRFGRHNRIFNQIKESYDKLGNSLGVLLQGMKGSGKSMLAEELGNWMVRQDLPVIMVDTPMSAEELRTIIRAVGPCMVYIDEFGKVYHDEHDRTNMLTLFSDTSFTGVLFVVTGNCDSEFSDYLFYRPQRFRFNVRFEQCIDSETLADILKIKQVDEFLHPLFREYTADPRSAINYDSLLCVINESAGVKTVDELIDRCAILNVPPLPKTQWYVKDVKVLKECDIEHDKGYQVACHVDHTGDVVSVFEGGQYGKKVTTITQPIGDLDRSKEHVLVLANDRVFEVTLAYGYTRYCPAAYHHTPFSVQAAPNQHDLNPRYGAPVQAALARPQGVSRFGQQTQ